MTKSIRVVIPPEVPEEVEHGIRAAVFAAVNGAALDWGEERVSANDIEVVRDGTPEAPVEVYAVLPAGKKPDWLEQVRKAVTAALQRKRVPVDPEHFHLTQADMTGGGMEEE